MITGTIVGTLLLEIAQPTLAWIFLLLPMEDHTKRSLCSLLLFTSGFKRMKRQSYGLTVYIVSLNPGMDSLFLLSKLPKIGVQTIMMAKVQTASAHHMKSEKRIQIMWSYSGLKWFFKCFFHLRWRPQCSRSSRRSSLCSSPSASHSTSSYPPPRYLYLYL